MRLALPENDTPARPSVHDDEKTLYLRSYLLMRLVIGLAGTALPFVLVIGKGQPVLDSLSAYYHTEMLDWFVGLLWVIVCSSSPTWCSTTTGTTS